jgi:hypothetical protein
MKVETKALATPTPFDSSGLSADELAVIGLTERDRVELNSIRDKEKAWTFGWPLGSLNAHLH